MHHIQFVLLDTDIRRLWYGAGWNALGRGLAASHKARSLINGRRVIGGRVVESPAFQLDLILVG